MWTGAEQSTQTSLVQWACDFPVGGPAMAAVQLLTTSAAVSPPDPLWGGIEETPASKSFQNGSSDRCRTFFPTVSSVRRCRPLFSPDVDFHTEISSVRCFVTAALASV